MYRETFLLFKYGYGATIAVVLSAIVILFSWLYLRRTLRSV
jgi:ABC-type sugar transport system permease subunit